VARALVSGSAVFEHFEGDAYLDPQVRALVAKAHAEIHLPGQFPEGNNAGAEVRVTLTDGRVLVSHVDRALGRTAQNAIPEARMRDKFRSCARRVLREEAVEPLLAAIDGFEAAPGVAPLMSMLMPSS
jgi:hypothetical protein